MTDNKIKAVFGLVLKGHARKKGDCHDEKSLVFPDNTEQNYLERDGICWVHEIKEKRAIPRYVQDIFSIIWEKDKKIYGKKLYCECNDCKDLGKIKKGLRKGDLTEGQNFIFSGENSFSFVMRPIQKTGIMDWNEFKELSQVKIMLVERQKQLEEQKNDDKNKFLGDRFF